MPTPDPARVRLADINLESYIYFGAGAAVAWQLADPGVGRGVARHSETIRRPLSRLRATMAYVYAVSLGTDADRAAIARHVNRAHAPVRGEGYSAFDRDLQLWVAATLYRGGVQMYELFVGPVPEASRESLYREAWAFGRTLQVDDAQWPPTADAFDAWWDARQRHLHVDAEVRAYFASVLAAGAPWYLRPALPLQAFVTRALLPPHLRKMFDLPWTAADERRWRRFRHWAPRLYWTLPAWVRHWPARFFLRQLRTPE
ncbi:oxygenase MpaB family protein [Pseudoxanthomonas sp. 10H]|uniref:oxygenase MpaB family protein n=1 Tax=Pseudoxanthomonas sp. 10H TaxID=3242729 RepID=UPI003557E57C